MINNSQKLLSQLIQILVFEKIIRIRAAHTDCELRVASFDDRKSSLTENNAERCESWQNVMSVQAK